MNDWLNALIVSIVISMPQSTNPSTVIKDTWTILQAIDAIASSMGNKPLMPKAFDDQGNVIAYGIMPADPVTPGTEFVATKKTVDGVPDVDVISLVEPPGTELFNMTFEPVFESLPEPVKKQAEDAVTITINNLNNVSGGKAVVQGLPDAAKSIADPAQNETIYNASNETEQKIIADLSTKNDLPMTAAMKKAVKKIGKRQDHSRVSKEYHEWKYCCVDSNNFSLLAGLNDGPITYTGPDALPTAAGVDPSSSAVPPYYKWIEHEELREVMKIVRRYRRLRSQCGGKALWTEQGFASKLAAIQFDLNGDTVNYEPLYTILVATSDFA